MAEMEFAKIHVFGCHKGPYTIMSEIPTGRKDGMFFVVDNKVNLDRRMGGKKLEFWNDCGAWVKGASPCSTFIETNGQLNNIVNRHDLFCIL